ncbi:acyltransferase [Enterococcus faecium]|uniref:acyltransferase n=1 Tax=Enterococcus faecium TaxID=1352 RepID=UPI00289229E3|nr:acyltransferase [Enterococcus faecium]MDT2289709.1 acyltransferase [Enterococcus faecium]
MISPNERAEQLRTTGTLTAGEKCEIYENVSFGSEPYLIKLGKQVRITSGVRFITHDGGMWVIRNLGLRPDADKMGTIEIGDNVMIGQNAIIMQNVKIGSNVVIGAGSVVSKDIPDNTVAAGVPAKVICTVQEYYNKNKSRIYDTKQLSYAAKKEYFLKEYNL